MGEGPTVRYALSTRSNRYEDHICCSVDEFVADVEEKWGATTYCESFGGEDWLLPYFDHDNKFPSEEEANANMWDWAVECSAAVEALFEGNGTQPNMIYGSRPGRWVKGKTGGEEYKVSLRTYVTNFQMRPCDIKALIHAKAEPHTIRAMFDCSIYPQPGKRHLLFMQGTRKPDTPNVMAPAVFDADLKQIRRVPRPFAAGFLAQYVVHNVHPNNPKLELPTDLKQAAAKDERSRHDVGRLHENYELRQPPPSGALGLAIAKMAEVAPAYSYKSTRGANYDFQKPNDTTGVCPYKCHHINNNTLAVHFRDDGLMEVYCFGSECRSEFRKRPFFLGRWKQVECMFSEEDANPTEDSEARAALEAINNQVKEILQYGDRGQAELVHREIGEDVKGDGDHYLIFNESVKLWTEQGDSVVKALASKVLWTRLKACQQQFKDGGLNDVKLEGCLGEMVSKANSASTACKVYTFLKGFLAFTTGPDRQRFFDSLDAVPHIIGVENGAVDLRTGSLVTRTREHMLTGYLNVQFEPAFKPTKMEAVMKQVMAGDSCEANWMQLNLGYALTGSSEIDFFLMLISAGRSCKSTLIDAMAKLLGKYAKKGHSGLLFSSATPPNNVDAERAELANKRFLYFSENKRNAKVDTAFFNETTGGDKFVGTPKNKKPIEITPYYSVWGAFNFPPVFESPMPFSCASRLGFVKMPVTFVQGLPSSEVTPTRQPLDTAFRGWLVSEEGQRELFHYAVEGAKRFYSDKEAIKTQMPPRIKNDTDSFNKSQDLLGEFIREMCTPDGSISRADLQFEFENQRGVQMKITEFVTAMAELGHRKTSQRIGGSTPKGYHLRLKTPEELE